MAVSTKGLRKITVDSKTYYWKFNEVIKVFSEQEKRNMLIVDIGWYDEWLYVNDVENAPPNFSPKTVTPGFISTSIHYAISQGWTNGKMKLRYEGEKFIVLECDSVQ